MSKIIVGIIVIVLIIGGYLVYRNSRDQVSPVETDNTSTTTLDGNDGNIVEEDPTVEVKEFTVNASSFKFAPSTMTVNKGDTVRIAVTNTGGVHDLKIDEFDAATRILNSGESQTITFVADQAGTFEYYCSIGNHRAMGMVGTLTVR